MSANPVFVPVAFADAVETIARCLAIGLRPDPEYKVSEWADKHRVLSSNSAEPGPWRTARTPYMREIMDALAPDNGIEEVVFMKPAQIGGSEAGNNWIGSIIDMGLGPTMIVQPTVSTADAYSKERIAPMIDDSPTLRTKVPKPKGKDGTNNTSYKEFKGGYLVITGANSAAELSSRPVRNLMLDEVDRYPLDVDGQGEPEGLARKRTDTFLGTRKIFLASTPTLKGFSRIEQSYSLTDQRKYFVPCLHCGEYQTLEWGQITWVNDDPSTASYACAHCGVAIDEADKVKMLEAGAWRATATGAKGRVGYSLNSLYSPWRRWSGVVRDFLDANKSAKAGDITKLKRWTNLELGQTWEDQGDGADTHALEKRAEAYSLRVVPDGGIILTAAVDVQMNRLEVATVAWARGEECWIIDHRILHGDPARKDVWNELDAYLLEPIQASGGSKLIRACAIDSGGHHTQQVYQFTTGKARRHVFALKGASQQGKPIIGKPSDVEVSHAGKKLKTGAQLWGVGVDTAKHLLYGRLRVGVPGPGYVHLSNQLSHEFFEQLTSEVLITKWYKGRPRREWVLRSGRRNEALDLMVYNIAAAYKLGVHRFSELEWQKLEAAKAARVPEKSAPVSQPELAEPVAPAAPAEQKALIVPVEEVAKQKSAVSVLFAARQQMRRRPSFVRI